MFIILGADGREYGPVKARLVHEWLAEGRATLQTKARRSGTTDWQTLADFTEFADPRASGSRPTGQTAPPFGRDAPAASASPLPASTPSASTRGEPPELLARAPSVAADEATPAPREMRLAAAIIDGLLKFLCVLPTMIPLYRFIHERSQSGELLKFQEAFDATNAILSEHLVKSFPLLIALVAAQMVLITVRGQSIGKLLCKLRIVRHDTGGPAGFGRGFALRSVLPYLVQQIPLAGVLFWVVDSGFIFRADHRCLHDLMAGTKVVLAREPRD